MHSAGGIQPHRNREQNVAAVLPAAAGNTWDAANMSPDGWGGTSYALKYVIYALIGLEASLFQALVCLSQWPYLLMH